MVRSLRADSTVSAEERKGEERGAFFSFSLLRTYCRVCTQANGTGLCHFLGYLFHDRFRIYGYSFQQLFAFSGFLGIVFCKNSFIGEQFWHFQIYGYDFQKILQIYGYTFEKVLRIYAWYFTI